MTRSILIVGWLVLCIGAGCSGEHSQSSSEEIAFEEVTRMSLPPEVKAIAHHSQANDNLLHNVHYWVLKGPDTSLQGLAASFKLERSDEDAKWQLPDMQAKLGLSLTREDVAEGYEGSPDGKRDRWLILFTEGRGALFVY